VESETVPELTPEQLKQEQERKRVREMLRHINVLIQGRVEHVRDELLHYAKENATSMPPDFQDFARKQRLDLNLFRRSLGETLCAHFGVNPHEWAELIQQASQILDGEVPTQLPID
jgi:hypothetical protein